MIIFAHTLKRILRNKVYLLVMLLAPLMTGFIFGLRCRRLSPWPGGLDDTP